MVETSRQPTLTGGRCCRRGWRRSTQQLGAADDSDFVERLAHVPLSSMTLRERSEVASKLGFDRFKALVLGGR